jgi:electron transfer flavoprotein alpha subunit
MNNSKIWVYCEKRGSHLAEIGLEMIGKARELAGVTGWQVAAVLAGGDVSGLADEALKYGVDQVLIAEHELLAEYCNEPYTKVLAAAANQYSPEVILIGATSLGTDLAPRLAARLRTGLSAHCVDLELQEDGGLLAVVPGWGGSIMAKISCPTRRPQMATVMPGVFDIPSPGQAKGEVIELSVELSQSDLSYEVLETVEVKAEQSPLDDAEVAVVGGWGVGSADNWKLVNKLAEELSGAVGATRPPVDEGWAKESQMIGTSGRSISPKLYIALALSGNTHHMVGVKKPGLAVGINQDPKSPIFNHCDVGIVGDFKEVIPELLKEIGRIKGAG